MSQYIDRILKNVPHRLLKWSLFASGLGFFLLCFAILVWVLGWPTAALVVILLFGLLALFRPVASQLRFANMVNRARKLTETARTSYTAETFTAWSQYPVTPQTRAKVDTTQESKPGQGIIIGRIDSDGRVLGLFGELPGVVYVDADQFTDQRRYRLDIVLLDGLVLVRKDFCGNRVGFVREYYNLALLHGIANVPAVYRADQAHHRLYKNYVFGQTLRDVLVNAGAEILTVQTQNDPEITNLDPAARIEAVWDRAITLIPSCLPENFLAELRNQVNRIHACGISKLSLTYGNVMIDHKTGLPWLIDFEGAQAFRFSFNPLFIYHRAQDRKKFQRLYKK